MIKDNKAYQLDEILQNYIEDFKEKSKTDAVKDIIVENSIPIVWFGDLEQYEKSKTKVITVGLNPSDCEFKEPRFAPLPQLDPGELKKVLDHYFEFNPYKKWFASGERVLNEFNSSYFDNKENRAVHIDLYSAIATNPTWGKLKPCLKNQLQRADLFETLFQYLNPDIVLVSVNRKIFNSTFGNSYTFVDQRCDGNRSKFYIRKFCRNDNGNKLLYWGLNNHGTFFGLSGEFIKRGIKEMSNISPYESSN